MQNILKKFTKQLITYIYRIQALDSIMWGYICIRFIDFMLKGKSLLDCTIFFVLMNMRNGKIIINKKREKVICGTYRKLRKTEISCLLDKTFLLFELSERMKMKKYFKKNNQLKY